MPAYESLLESTPSLWDVDDGPMLRKRETVMNVCAVQVLLSIALLVIFLRRSPVLLVLHPFFIAAGILGYIGASRGNSFMVAAHVMGGGGLALVFMVYIIAESFLKRSGADLFFFYISFPMDLYLLSTAGFSVILFFSLRQLKKNLRERREQAHPPPARAPARAPRPTAPDAGRRRPAVPPTRPRPRRPRFAPPRP